MTFLKQTIRDVPLEHKVVLVRADYNVPIDENGKIADDLRIRASVPTLRYLLERGCKVVVMSHLGRPNGRDMSLSLEQIGERLAFYLGVPIHFVNDCKGDRVHQTIKTAPKNSVILLENLRFYAQEEANDHGFAKEIAKATGARYFVQDGFGVVHRAHASTEAIALCIPGVAGLLLEHEYETITHAMSEPDRPLIAIMGGAKVSDKISVIERFIQKADTILIGGAMANTFLAYRGIFMGKSKFEKDETEALDAIYKAAAQKVGADNVDEFIMLPSDLAIAKRIDASQKRRICNVDELANDDIALDIGDQTIETYTAKLNEAKTVIWNGPVGYSTLPEFAHGSARIALTLAAHPNITSVVGGGDTAEFALKWDGQGGKSFTHVSTGGGAGLELMAGDKLPGVECLLDAGV